MDTSTSTGRAKHRIAQITARLQTKHPKAARDGELASMLEDLSYIVDNEVTDKRCTCVWSEPHQPSCPNAQAA